MNGTISAENIDFIFNYYTMNTTNAVQPKLSDIIKEQISMLDIFNKRLDWLTNNLTSITWLYCMPKLECSSSECRDDWEWMSMLLWSLDRQISNIGSYIADLEYIIGRI